MEAAGSGAPGLRVSRPEITCLRCYCSCNCRPRCRERRRRCDCRRRREPAPAAASLPIAERLRKARRPTCGPGAHAGGRRPVLCWAWAGSPPHGRGREAQPLAAGSESAGGGRGPAGSGLLRRSRPFLRVRVGPRATPAAQAIARGCSREVLGGAGAAAVLVRRRSMFLVTAPMTGPGPRSWLRTRRHSRVTGKYPSHRQISESQSESRIHGGFTDR